MTYNAVAYIRVSTEEQAEKGYGLAVQEERIQGMITAKGWTLTKIYQDAGYSGGKLSRPALQEMLTDISNKEKGINAVIVYKLDRLSRKQRDTMYLIEDAFLKNDVELVSLCESLDTSSPTGRAMIGMLSVFAQLERDTITDRLSDGRKQKAKTGGYSGGNSPIGYTRERATKELHLNASQTETVQRVFELKNEGLKLQHIADALNSEHRTTKENKSFTPTQVWRILGREAFYKGKYRYSSVAETAGHHQAII